MTKTHRERERHQYRLTCRTSTRCSARETQQFCKSHTFHSVAVLAQIIAGRVALQILKSNINWREASLVTHGTRSHH